jgi:hypothetical protein
MSLTSAVRKTASFYDRVYAERKLDAADLKELSICFEEHKTARSPLDKLDEQTRTAILLLLSEHPAWMVSQLLAQEPPLGISLTISDSSLNKFRTRCKERAAKNSRKTRYNEIEQVVINNHGDTFHSSIHLLEGRLLKALSNDNTPSDDLQRISRALASLRRQAYSEGRPPAVFHISPETKSLSEGSRADSNSSAEPTNLRVDEPVTIPETSTL